MNEADSRGLRRAIWGKPTKEEVVYVETVDDGLFYCATCCAALNDESQGEVEHYECDRDGCQACVCVGCAGADIEGWVCEWCGTAPAE